MQYHGIVSSFLDFMTYLLRKLVYMTTFLKTFFLICASTILFAVYFFCSNEFMLCHIAYWTNGIFTT